VFADATSQLWLSDSDVVADPLSCPIEATNARVARCTLAPPCPPPPQGPLLGVHRPAPPQAGQPFVLEFRSEPTTLVFVLASSRLADVPGPQLEQIAYLSQPECFSVGVLTADGTGAATGTWQLPPGPFEQDGHSHAAERLRPGQGEAQLGKPAPHCGLYHA